jgi:ABC-type phosphate/phosphonate transport system substrate-binding protein
MLEQTQHYPCILDIVITQKSIRTRRFLICLALSAVVISSAAAQERVAFVGVALDTETREADRRLRTYLAHQASLSFAPEELEYAQVIERLVSWKREEGVYLARTTPYAHVVSEMLGADLEVLATYISSATESPTYRAYFVAPKDALPIDPTPEDVVSWISGSKRRLRFVHHSQFSTSSFFLPALYFRSNLIFNTAEPTESITALEVVRSQQNSSSALIEAVARGEADLAAVWDGTRARFTGPRADPTDTAGGREVVFVPLPSAIPNDLLVCSRWAPPELKERVRAAIRHMQPGEIGVGDFKHWVDIVETPDARSALARLRWLAREQAAPVTVDVRSAGGARAATQEMLDAARHAVRLSGMEFVLFDEDFHEHIDYVWTIDRIHDGSARLRSSIPGADIDDQVFPISFRGAHDLTGRIVSLMYGKLHRIRYVWPYSGRQPRIIRDTTLALAPGAEVPVQQITWLDPERNSFRAGPGFSVRVRESSMFVHALEADDFLRAGAGAITLDPMSNVAYRVYQLRDEPPNNIHRVATGALLGLLLLAAVAAVMAVRGRRGPGFRLDGETLAS